VSSVYCTSCGADNPADAAFCRQCGVPLRTRPAAGVAPAATAAAGAAGTAPAAEASAEAAAGSVPAEAPPPAAAPITTPGRRRRRLWLLVAAVVALLALAGAAAVLLRHPAPPAKAHLTWTTIGSSVNGRPIEAATFGTGADRRVLVIGGVHGGEYGAGAAKQLAKYLFAHPEAVPAGATIDVIRDLNPDGIATGMRGNAHRVDLNRNMPTANWHSRLSPLDQSRSQFHLSGGSVPGSEPEVQTLVERLKRGYAAVLSLHSHGGILDGQGPGGRDLARRMSAAGGLKLGGVTYDKYITGSMGQYIPATYGIPIVTVELDSPRLDQGMLDALIVPAQ